MTDHISDDKSVTLRKYKTLLEGRHWSLKVSSDPGYWSLGFFQLNGIHKGAKWKNFYISLGPLEVIRYSAPRVKA